jgi:UDP-N-acetylmuramate dehydrogenase
MIWPRRPEDVIDLCGWMGGRGLGWRHLGGGTNLLVSDEGVPQPVWNFTGLNGAADIGEEAAHLPAGTVTAQALRRTAEAGRDGLVWAAGLPGTIGGAAAGNAGCWGGEMADVVDYLDVVDGRGEAMRIPADELTWAYRSLTLPVPPDSGAAIVAVGLRLSPADPGALRRRYEELQRFKRERQPVGARNSGCIFRNPEGSSAGLLLDRAGCKGMRIGDAEISGVHANFIVNHGAATCAEVLRLVEQVRARVRERFDVDLMPEICRW